jgi:hypothetical protein
MRLLDHTSYKLRQRAYAVPMSVCGVADWLENSLWDRERRIWKMTSIDLPEWINRHLSGSASQATIAIHKWWRRYLPDRTAAWVNAAMTLMITSLPAEARFLVHLRKH